MGNVHQYMQRLGQIFKSTHPIKRISLYFNFFLFCVFVVFFFFWGGLGGNTELLFTKRFQNNVQQVGSGEKKGIALSTYNLS